MANPTYQQVQRFGKMVSDVATKQAEYYINDLKQFRNNTRGKTPAEYAKWYAAHSPAGKVSSALGAQWYDFCNDSGVGAGVIDTGGTDDMDAAIDELYEKYDAGVIDDKQLEDGLHDAMVDHCKRIVRDTVLGNMYRSLEQPAVTDTTSRQRGKRNKRSGVSWARVPIGDKTCAWCVMLASHGYWYTSERTAKYRWDGRLFHAGCDCVVVPDTRPADIEGYDVEAYEDMYYTANDLRKRVMRDRDVDPVLYDRIAKAKSEHSENALPWSATNETMITMRYLYNLK